MKKKYSASEIDFGGGIPADQIDFSDAPADTPDKRDPTTMGFVDSFMSMIRGEKFLNAPKPVDPTFDNPYFKSIAAVGKFANKGNQELAGLMAEKGGVPGAVAGTVLGTASEFLLPQTEEGAGLSALSGLAGAPASGANPNRGISAAGPATPKVVRPGPIDKATGAAISVGTAIPVRYTSAVIADPTILSAETPGMAQVSKEYQQVFQRLGIKFDSDLMKRLTNKRYFPGENQVGELNTIIDDTLTKVENWKPGMTPLDPAELFAGRSAAAAAKRSNMYATNKSFRNFIDGAQQSLDDALENHGLPEIKALSTRYFRAVAKEQFEHIIPQNKNMSPNALRGLLIGKLLTDAGSELLAGNPGQAALAAVKAGLMSPVVVGGAIRTVAGQVPGTAGFNLPAQTLPALANAALNREQP